MQPCKLGVGFRRQVGNQAAATQQSQKATQTRDTAGGMRPGEQLCQHEAGPKLGLQHRQHIHNTVRAYQQGAFYLLRYVLRAAYNGSALHDFLLIVFLIDSSCHPVAPASTSYLFWLFCILQHWLTQFRI